MEEKRLNQFMADVWGKQQFGQGEATAKGFNHIATLDCHLLTRLELASGSASRYFRDTQGNDESHE